MEEVYDVIIIGGGVSGFAAALYAGRFQLKTAVIAELPGGAIINTNEIANYPGFKMISGYDLFTKIQEHAQDYEIKVINNRVTNILKNESAFTIDTITEKYKSKTVIIATGSEWKKLGVPGEKEFTGKGVHYCALCDGAFYKDKIIGIVGGSDSAAKEALLLAQYAKKVYIIYRRENIRAEPIIIKHINENQKIEIIKNTNIVEIKGENVVRSVVFDSTYNGSKEFNLDAIFIAVGHIPLSGIAKNLDVEINKKSEIITDKKGQTNIPGLFAAGDVTDTEFKQVITGVAEGVKAAYSAYRFLTSNRG